MNDSELPAQAPANPDQAPRWGQDDASFIAAGGEPGLQRLVESFYTHMHQRPDALRVRQMHDKDLTVTIDKLARFLCGWLGGPKRYNEKYGLIRLPMAHAHLSIDETDARSWLACMQAALDEQPYDRGFVAYLMAQFAVPAGRIVLTCNAAGRSRPGT